MNTYFQRHNPIVSRKVEHVETYISVVTISVRQFIRDDIDIKVEPHRRSSSTLPPSSGVFMVQSSTDRVSHPNAFITTVRVTAHYTTQVNTQAVTHPSTNRARHRLTWLLDEKRFGLG